MASPLLLLLPYHYLKATLHSASRLHLHLGVGEGLLQLQLLRRESAHVAAQPAEEEARPLWGRVSLIVATPAELGEAFERFKSWAAVDQFFGASLPRAVKRHHRPILAVAFGLAVMGFASTAATLEADDEPPRFFRRSHNLGLVHDLAEYFAAEADRGGLSSAGGAINVDVEAPMPAPTSRPITAPTT